MFVKVLYFSPKKKFIHIFHFYTNLYQKIPLFFPPKTKENKMSSLYSFPEEQIDKHLQNHPKQLSFLFKYWNEVSSGHRKKHLIEKIESHQIPLHEWELFKKEFFQKEEKKDKDSTSCLPLVAIPSVKLNGQYETFILFYVPSFFTEEYSPTKGGTGLFIITENQFQETLSSIKKKFLEVEQEQITYLDLLEEIFDCKDIDQRPIRLGRIEEVETTSREEEEKEKTEREQLFARYNLSSHGTSNVITTSISSYISPKLNIHYWSFQPFGYDSNLWLPIWSKMKQSSQHVKMSLLEFEFPRVLIVGLQAVHDFPLPLSVDAIYGSWSNLTHLTNFKIKFF